MRNITNYQGLQENRRVSSSLGSQQSNGYNSYNEVNEVHTSSRFTNQSSFAGIFPLYNTYPPLGVN